MLLSIFKNFKFLIAEKLFREKDKDGRTVYQSWAANKQSIDWARPLISALPERAAFFMPGQNKNNLHYPGIISKRR